MAKNIKGIFEQITPENIKNIPIIQKSIDVFIQALEDLSKESIDIKNAFENEKIREELIKIYINDLYQILSNVQNNREVIDAIERINSYYNGVEFYKKDVIINIVKYINEEHFITFKSFKESKGLVDAIKYIYELINTLFTSSNTENYEFILQENGPFQLDIKGSLPEEVYNNIVWPLAHPLGFVYVYVRYILLNLEDYFPELKITYFTDKLEVRCFLENGQTITTPIINSRYDQTKIIKIENFEDISKKTIVYYLNNNTYLRQVTDRNGQTSVEWLNNDGSVYKSFAEHCSIYASYEVRVETTAGDEKLDNKEITENDVWARLFDETNYLYLSWRDVGYNQFWDEDGNYYPNHTLKNQKQIEKTPNYTAKYSNSLKKWFDIIQPSLKRKSWYKSSYIQQIKGEKTLPSDYFINLFQSVLNKTNYTQEELEFKLWLDTFILNELIGENGLFPSNSVEINSFNINEIGTYIGVRKLTNQEISSKQINGYKFDDFSIGDINQTNSLDIQDIETFRNIITEYSAKTFADRECVQNSDIVYNENFVEGDPINLQYQTFECKTDEVDSFLLDNILVNDKIEYIHIQQTISKTEDFIFTDYEYFKMFLKINEEINTYIEIDLQNNDLLYIGENNKRIGSNNAYIKGKENIYAVNADVFFEKFDTESIEQFDFGVYRNGEKVKDNNVSILLG